MALDDQRVEVLRLLLVEPVDTEVIEDEQVRLVAASKDEGLRQVASASLGLSGESRARH